MADINTDSEDELPHGWEERVSIEGKVFYACHETKGTQWTHPITGKRKKVCGELPFGWERKIGDSGYVYYIDHVNKKTTFTDPRLAFAIEYDEQPGDMSNIRQKYDAFTEGLQIVRGKDFSHMYAVVTGASSGIGFETARSLASAGCVVVMAAREGQRLTEAVKTIEREYPHARVRPLPIDLSSLRNVKQFVEKYLEFKWPLHLLVLNAGILSPPYTQTEDGFELSFQVNHLSHHYLSRLFESLMKRSAPARVVVVSSESHRFKGSNVKSAEDIKIENLSPDKKNYHGLTQYGLTKLLNIAFSGAFNRRTVLDRIFCNSLHPGNCINTSLSNNWWGYQILFKILSPFTKSIQQGAATTIYLATSVDLHAVGGMYFNHCWVCDSSELARDEKFGDAVFELCEKLISDKMGEEAFNVKLFPEEEYNLLERPGASGDAHTSKLTNPYLIELL